MPIRTCVICREKFDKKDLLRHVWSGKEPLADPEQKRAGRGAYCCSDDSCWKQFWSAEKRWKSIFHL